MCSYGEPGNHGAAPRVLTVNKSFRINELRTFSRWAEMGPPADPVSDSRFRPT